MHLVFWKGKVLYTCKEGPYAYSQAQMNLDSIRNRQSFFSVYVQGPDSASQILKDLLSQVRISNGAVWEFRSYPWLLPWIKPSFIEWPPFFLVLSLHVTTLEKIHSVFGGCLTRQNLMYRIRVSGPYCYSRPLFSWANSFCIVVTKKIGNYFFECINSKKNSKILGITHQILETTKKLYQKNLNLSK